MFWRSGLTPVFGELHRSKPVAAMVSTGDWLLLIGIGGERSLSPRWALQRTPPSWTDDVNENWLMSSWKEEDFESSIFKCCFYGYYYMDICLDLYLNLTASLDSS